MEQRRLRATQCILKVKCKTSLLYKILKGCRIAGWDGSSLLATVPYATYRELYEHSRLPVPCRAPGHDTAASSAAPINESCVGTYATARHSRAERCASVAHSAPTNCASVGSSHMDPASSSTFGVRSASCSQGSASQREAPKMHRFLRARTQNRSWKRLRSHR